MEKFILRHFERTKGDAEQIERMYGSDGVKINNRKGDLRLYPDSVINHDLWIAMDDQRQWLQSSTRKNEKLIK